MSAPCRVGRSCGVFPIPSSCEAMARGQRPRVAMHEPTRARAAAQAYTARTTRMQRMVSASEPTTCEAIAIVPHRYSLRSSRVTISAENVENVVKPPRNPVVARSCISGLIIAWRVMISIAKPINKPPMRLALKVPSGSVGNTGLSMTPSPQRSQAPIAAPAPTARIPPQGIQNPFRANTARQSHRRSSADKLVHVIRAKADVTVMPAAHLDLGEHVLVSNLSPGLVEVNHGAADIEEGDHFAAVVGNDESMDLARRLVDKASLVRHSIVLEIAPLALDHVPDDDHRMAVARQYSRTPHAQQIAP